MIYFFILKIFTEHLLGTRHSKQKRQIPTLRKHTFYSGEQTINKNMKRNYTGAMAIKAVENASLHKADEV